MLQSVLECRQAQHNQKLFASFFRKEVLPFGPTDPEIDRLVFA
jgi:hypothetical protein